MSVVEPIRVKLSGSPGANQYVCFQREASSPAEESKGQGSPARSPGHTDDNRTVGSGQEDKDGDDEGEEGDGESGINQSEDDDDDENAKLKEKNGGNCQNISQQQSSRNKRKNFRPRNIVSSYDNAQWAEPLDLSEGTPNGSFRRDSESADESVLKSPNVHEMDDGNRLVIDEEDGVMDLSTCVKAGMTNSGEMSSVAKAHFANAVFNNVNINKSVGAGGEAVTSSADASAMKDYAEDTMKELLGLYGLNNEMVESITQNVPLQNFSSGKSLLTFYWA